MNGLTMKFPVTELLGALKANRATHETMATEAKRNYLVALQKELASKLKDLEQGKKVNPNSKLPIPGDNLEEYDTAISMLNFTCDKEVTLTQDQYHSYVLDKWRWKKEFLTTASNYSKLAEDELVGATLGE